MKQRKQIIQTFIFDTNRQNQGIKSLKTAIKDVTKTLINIEIRIIYKLSG